MLDLLEQRKKRQNFVLRKLSFFLTILIVDFSSDPKQTKLISQDYSDGDFQSLILNKQYWFPKNILMVIFSFRSSLCFLVS